MTARATQPKADRFQNPSRLRMPRSAVRALVAAPVLVSVGLVASTFGPYVGRAARYLSDADLRWLVAAVAAELWSMEAFARVQRRLLSSGGTRVSLRDMVATSYAANALNMTLPAGTALSAGYTFRRMRKFGASAPSAGFAVIAAGLLSTMSFALLALVGSVVIGLDQISPVLLVAEVLAVLALAYATRRVLDEPTILHRGTDFALGWVNRAMRRPVGTGVAGAHEFLHALTGIRPRRRDWGRALAAAAGNWLADLGCLVASLRAVGVDASLSLIIVTFLAGATASSLSLTPGGLGVVDAAMLVALTHGGVHFAPAIAAVLLYRLITVVLIVTLGWLAWALNWRHEHLPAESRNRRSARRRLCAG